MKKTKTLSAEAKRELVQRCMMFVDQNGKSEILSKESTPVNCSLRMRYEEKGLHIEFHAYSHCQGNGSCGVIVHFRGRKVFAAGGGFTAAPFDVRVSCYVPGAWSARIPSLQTLEARLRMKRRR